MSENYAIIEGKRYPIEFGGYDRETYKHLSACLANVPGNCCQCGAHERAKRVFLAVADPRSPEPQSSSHSEIP